MISAEKAKRLRAVIERSVSAAGLDDILHIVTSLRGE